MVIEKNSSKIAVIDTELHSPHSRDTVMSSEYDEDAQQKNLASVLKSEDDDDDFDDSESGAGSDDDFDLIELGESGEEFCQIGDKKCSVPYELYDLPGLKDVLSLEVWNDVLTEDDRLNLSKYLPDMDLENYVHTLKQLFSGDNLLFGSPLCKFFEMLKGGMFEPRVSLYRKGLNFFQKRQHYHNLFKYQNTMVNNLHQIRDAWLNCRGHSIEEKLHIWYIVKSQRNEDIEAFFSDPYDKYESSDAPWSNSLKDRNLQFSSYRIKPHLELSSHSQKPTPEVVFKHGKRISKRNSKFDTLKIATVKEIDESVPSTLLGVPMRSHRYDSSEALMANEGILEDDESESIFHVAANRDQNLRNIRAKAEEDLDSFLGSSGKVNPLGRNKTINKLSDMTMLTVRPSSGRSINGGKNIKHEENFQQIALGNQTKHTKGRKSNVFSKGKAHFTAKSKKWDNGNKFVGGVDKEDMDTILRNEDTESDSSEHVDENGSSLMRRNWAYATSSVPESRHRLDVKKLKLANKDNTESYSNLDGSAHMLEKMKYFNLDAVGASESNGYLDADGFRIPSQKYSTNQRKRRKGPIADDPSLPQSSQMHESFEEEFFSTKAFDNGAPSKLGKKNRKVGYHPEASLVGSKNLIKKWKLDPQDLETNASELQLENIRSIKKRGKSKLNEKVYVHENGVSHPLNMELEMEIEDTESVPKRQRKSFPLITPSVPSNFSFSIIHLLSAVRMAMITLLPDDTHGVKHTCKNDSEQGIKEEEQANKPDGFSTNFDQNLDIITPQAHANVPALNVQEIINRVKSNPGDPSILETQEPLQDLIRGVLKIFSSRTSPLGAKGWKPLVAYDKPKRSWLWIGPVTNNSSEYEEVTSPDSWGLPHKMLVKLVDSFANWLKNSQEILKQIGSLPSPPLTLMQINLDEKERFKDLRAQKSLITINPSSEEVKAYFHKEEELRYQIPDRAFSYTAIDGKKSIVAPLRRCGGKPTSKARDHFMLKSDRPPHVTILCLVRDAASRLPGSTGTRSDVCTLIRDSKYIVEDVSDTQVNQVVSGALDRLHYERDPCVQFDSERKLWVYLHRDREEEDFEDDGTSSTKKWKRQKKEGLEPNLISDLNAPQNNSDYNTIIPFISNETSKLLSHETSANEDFDDDTLVNPAPP